ncbi:MAG: leucine-rich repeat domain-containing protein [Promethearchaeota archaeon]
MKDSKKIITEIEKFLGKSIPKVDEIGISSLGIQYKNNTEEVKGLCLNHCKLKSIPVSICELKTLQILDLAFNEIEIIPDWIVDLQLTELNLNNNRIKKLPKKTGNMSTLLFLKILNNPLHKLPISLRRFSDMYSNFKELRIKDYGWDKSSLETIRLMKERGVRVFGLKK